MTDCPEEVLRIEITKGEAGLLHVTSPDEPGLFLSGEDEAELRRLAPLGVIVLRDAEIKRLRDENARLQEVLTFYRDEWLTNEDGGGEEWNTRRWKEPTEALWSDEGLKARVALDPALAAALDTLAQEDRP